MGRYDKMVCMKNIYFLAKEKNLKIRDLETTAGVSLGYFSRLTKEDNKSNPAVETLALVADKLGVTLDALISFDFSGLTHNERLVLNFVDKLIRDTNDELFLWNRETMSALQNLQIEGDGTVDHPIFDTKIRDIDYAIYEPYYRSLFRPGFDATVAGDCFNVNIGGSTLFLMDVQFTEDSNDPVAHHELELYLYQNGVNTVCHYDTDLDESYPLNAAIVKLYETAKESSTHMKLTGTVINAIESFLNGNQSSDTTDEYPF